jgi:aryl-alcohol dehydrogenase-like predicted oxidoreductase
MRYRLLGGSGLKVSPLCLGTMNFGNDGWGCDERSSRAILHRFLELGGNFIDTANVYSGGRSEEIVGRALGPRRDDVVLATKCYFPLGDGPNRTGATRRNVREQLEGSLRRLGTEWVDLLQVHIWDPLTPIEETLSVLSDLVHEGKVHYLGACNFAAWQLVMAQERAEQLGLEKLITIQPQYNLLCRDVESEIVPAADAYDMGLLAWSPLAFGMLSGKYDRRSSSGPPGARLSDPHEDDVMHKWRERYFTDEHFAIVDAVVEVARRLDCTPVALSLRWLLEQPALSAAIIGPRSVEQLEGNWAALALDLSEEILEHLDLVSTPEHNYLEFMQGHYFERRTRDLD